MAEYRFIQAAHDGRVLTITLNRPERMNALHPEAHAELSAAFDGFAADPDLWLAILTGAGDRAFCAGFDLKWLAETGGTGDEMPVTGFGGLTARFDLDKPLIAAVNGLAMGGGFELALACDLVIAADGARFALPEPRVGLAALGGGVHRLPRQIGLKRAMGMMLTGRHVTAAEGQALGFVNEVAPAGELMPAARRWADQILACSPMSIRATKQAAMRGLTVGDLEIAYRTHYPAVRAMQESEDTREGPRAFAEKRQPNWKGR